MPIPSHLALIRQFCWKRQFCCIIVPGCETSSTEFELTCFHASVLVVLFFRFFFFLLISWHKMPCSCTCTAWACLKVRIRASVGRCSISLFVLCVTICIIFHCLCYISLFMLYVTVCVIFHCLCYMSLFVL